MKAATRRHISRVLRDLNLYPDRSKFENVVRGFVWMVSWFVGIVMNSSADPQALGGAYIIFSASLLLEFIPEKKSEKLAKTVHGLFCFLLVIMALCAVILTIFNPDSTSPTGNVELITNLIKTLYPIGWSVFAILLAGVLLVLTEANKLFFDEDAETRRMREEKKAEVQEQFMRNLKGMQEGENNDE